MDIKYLEDKLLKNDGSINFEEAMELTNFPKNRILELTSLARKVTSVSYTHLTLPTKRIV